MASPSDLWSLVSQRVYTMVYHGTLQLVRPPEDTFHRSTIPDAVKALKRPVQQTVVGALHSIQAEVDRLCLAHESIHRTGHQPQTSPSALGSMFSTTSFGFAP